MSPQAARARKQVKEHPTLGCNVVVGTGAKVLGNIQGGITSVLVPVRSFCGMSPVIVPWWGCQGGLFLAAVAVVPCNTANSPIWKQWCCDRSWIGWQRQKANCQKSWPLSYQLFGYQETPRLRDSEIIFIYSPCSLLPTPPLPTSHFPLPTAPSPPVPRSLFSVTSKSDTLPALFSGSGVEIKAATFKRQVS